MALLLVPLTALEALDVDRGLALQDAAPPYGDAHAAGQRRFAHEQPQAPLALVAGELPIWVLRSGPEVTSHVTKYLK